MALGDGSDDVALNAAWDEFCDRLKAAGQRVFKDDNSALGVQRADGFRFLTQNLGQAFDLALETKDTRYPAIHMFCSPTRKLGGDCADFIYQQAWIDGESTYRIVGDRGTARFLNVTVQGPRPRRPRRAARTVRGCAGGEPVRRAADDCLRRQLRDLRSAVGCRARTGFPPLMAHASCSSARASTHGTSGLPACRSSGLGWIHPSRCPPRRR